MVSVTKIQPIVHVRVPLRYTLWFIDSWVTALGSPYRLLLAKANVVTHLGSPPPLDSPTKEFLNQESDIFIAHTPSHVDPYQAWRVDVTGDSLRLQVSQPTKITRAQSPAHSSSQAKT
jgi:hypothetical protein